MNTVNITINGRANIVPSGTSVLNAAKLCGIFLPSLCHHPDQKVKANCRVCLVQIEGVNGLVTACSTAVSEGVKIVTNSPIVRDTVRTVVELILADHPQDCLTCIRSGNCELRKLSEKLGVGKIDGERSEGGCNRLPIDNSTPSIVRNPNKCIKCGRCAEVCHHIQEVGVLYTHGRSADICVAPEFGKELIDSGCVMCGQCASVCPVGAIYENNEIDLVLNAIDNPKKHVVVQTAPSIHVSIAEEFGLSPGEISTGKLVTALRALGFDRVFDTNFSADLTIMEEGNELLHRIKNGGVLPMITSCSPGWINYIETYYPEMLPHLSSCKSPQQMFGAVAKTYYAQKAGIDPEDVFVVSIMPCTAKKFESARSEMNDSGYRDVDVALTTRELGRLLRRDGIDFSSLEDGEFDSVLGASTGAGVIFGATGGVMEAALRTVYEIVTNETLQELEFNDIRGLSGIKEASVMLSGNNVKVAVAHGLGNAKKMLNLIATGKADYTFIEVMCCPGGCVGGGGQPYGTNNAVRQKRIAAIYEKDRKMPLRRSHENPEIKTLYNEFLVAPLGEKSHKLLHTKYLARKR